MASSRADSLSPTRDDTLPFIHDVIIVGAGPCGLALAARLREHTPSALFTDEEHHRYHWINKHSDNAAIKNYKTGRLQRSTGYHRKRKNENVQLSMLVLDGSGDTWMSKWNSHFSELMISHLRSPMFFHPDPHDRDGLLAYAHAKGREEECLEIAGCVGKEISKHQLKKRRKAKAAREQPRAAITIDERDRKDYFAPPSDLFQDYCAWIAERYGLRDKDLITKAVVNNIDYDFIPAVSPDKEIFTIKTDNCIFYTHSVVLAVGSGNGPSVPSPFPQDCCPCACHALQQLDELLNARLRAHNTANVLVIGGGLTSAQISDRTIRRGATKVYHLMRGPMKIKPFDVDLSWMAKFRNHEKASFWSADTDQERSELIKAARGGGSITPRYAKILEQHVRTGKLALHTDTTVQTANFNTLDQTWCITTQPPIPDLPVINFVYFATGAQSDFQELPYLQGLQKKFPIEAVDGLPALTDDLMWSADVPLFMTGKFAALRVGPGAGNLEGARLGAERIAWAMPDVLGGEAGGYVAATEASEERRRYAAGIGSRFEALEME